jgi:hypothetical protein
MGKSWETRVTIHRTKGEKSIAFEILDYGYEEESWTMDMRKNDFSSLPISMQ